jgi:pimeloyl-ACP methyl ester carboxylesterase
LYPPGTFERGRLVFAPIPLPQARESADWPEVFRLIAPRVTVPVRLTFGQHERFWVVDDDALAEIRSLFTGTSRFELAIQEGAGHNVSLGLGAREYHRRALAFAEECIAWRLA